MESVASHGWQLFSSAWDQTTNSLIGTEFNKFKQWQSALLVVVSYAKLICFQVVRSFGSIKVHPSAHLLAATIGHVLAQLDPSSAHLKAGSTCKQKKHMLLQLQGRTWQVLTSTRAVAVRSQWGQIAWMTKRRNLFLNWISWCTGDQLSRVVRKMDDCLVLHVNLPTAITHWCDSIQCLAGAPALEVACDHSYVKMCLHISFQKFHGCCNMVEHGFGAHTVALSIELMP